MNSLDHSEDYSIKELHRDENHRVANNEKLGACPDQDMLVLAPLSTMSGY